MKNRQRISCSSFGALILVAANGAWAGDLVWTEDVVEQIPIRADWYRSLEVETHNGSIGLVAVSDGSGESYVIVTKRGGGYTKGAADRAVEQIEIVIKEDKDQLEIGWKWGANRKKTHEAIVSFATNAAGALAFLIVSWVVAGWVRRIVRRSFETAGVDDTLGIFLSNLARWAILIMTVLAALGRRAHGGGAQIADEIGGGGAARRPVRSR